MKKFTTANIDLQNIMKNYYEQFMPINLNTEKNFIEYYTLSLSTTEPQRENMSTQ